MTSVLGSPQQSSSSSFGSDLLEAELEKCLQESDEAADFEPDQTSVQVRVGEKRAREDLGSTLDVRIDSR